MLQKIINIYFYEMIFRNSMNKKSKFCREYVRKMEDEDRWGKIQLNNNNNLLVSMWPTSY